MVIIWLMIVNNAGWWLTYPSENDGVRQLGLLFPTYGKIQMFQTTNQP